MNGKVVADDKRYRITDYEFEGFTISQTILHAGQKTRGHSHPAPEVMIFIEGGYLKQGEQIRRKYNGEIVEVEPNQFHQVEAPLISPTIFWSIFKGKREDRQAKY